MVVKKEKKQDRNLMIQSVSIPHFDGETPNLCLEYLIRAITTPQLIKCQIKDLRNNRLIIKIG